MPQGLVLYGFYITIIAYKILFLMLDIPKSSCTQGFKKKKLYLK